MPLGFANFRHDPTLSSRSPQAQKPSVEVAQQKASSSAASVSSEQPLIEEKKTDHTPKKNTLREMVDAIKPKQW